VKIEVLGPGCAKCEKLLENVQAAVRDLGIDAEVTKVTDIAEIMKHGVLLTPALVVDGEVKSAGKVPGVDGIKELFGSSA